MGKVVEFGRRDKIKLAVGSWQQEYLLFPSIYNNAIGELPSKNKIPAGAEITLHPGNGAHLLVNDQLLRVLALSPRELREAVFITAQKILRFRCTYSSLNNILQFTSFLKIISYYVNKLGAVVLDNIGMRCWLPEEWLRIIDGGQMDFRNHLTVHSVLEKESDRYWIHTHGMIQFACPDLEARMVSQSGKSPTLQLISRFTNYLIKNGPVFKDGCKIPIIKGKCWVTLKHYNEMPGDNHYRNNYFRIMIMSKELGGSFQTSIKHLN